MTFSSQKRNFYTAGFFVQYDLLPSGKYESRLYPEVSYNLSNYCTCEFGDPFKFKNLHKIGVGLGWDYVLSKRFVLETGFYNYVILNKLDFHKYNFTQYVIGLSYNISKPYK